MTQDFPPRDAIPPRQVYFVNLLQGAQEYAALSLTNKCSTT
ncbi:hypothetical protein [Streptomyces sp. NPDC054794]